MTAKVRNLNEAYDAYWSSKTFRENQAAYHEILLFGGKDGYRFGWRVAVARWLRLMALKIEPK